MLCSYKILSYFLYRAVPTLSPFPPFLSPSLPTYLRSLFHLSPSPPSVQPYLFISSRSLLPRPYIAPALLPVAAQPITLQLTFPSTQPPPFNPIPTHSASPHLTPSHLTPLHTGTGLSPPPCPLGRYGNTTGLGSEDACTMCDAGLYCSTPGLSHPNGICTPGFYCPEGTFFLKDEHDLSSVVYTISFGFKFLPFQVIFSFLFVFQPFCVSSFPLPPSLVLMFSSILTPLLFHLLS